MSTKNPGFDHIVPVRFSSKFLAQILKRNSNASKFIRAACADAIRFESIISQAKHFCNKPSALKVVIK
jgi:hypothetical protein